MTTIKEDFCKCMGYEDLGWFFNLPRDIIAVSNGVLKFMDEDYLDVSDKTVGEIFTFIKTNQNPELTARIEDIKTHFGADYNKVLELLKQNMDLFYGRDGYNFNYVHPKKRASDKKMGITIMFENYNEEFLFMLYHGINCQAGASSMIAATMEKLVHRGKEGLDKYKEWLKVAKILQKYGVMLSSDKTFIIDGDKLRLYIKYYAITKDGLDEKLLGMCGRDSGGQYLLYNGAEEFDTLCSMLES